MRSKMEVPPNLERCIRSIIAAFFSFILMTPLFSQKVGIGTSTPVATLNLLGPGLNPTIPGSESSAIFRIGVSALEGVDIGKMGNYPFTGWIQSGYGGIAPDPLSLQPVGGNVGIGTTSPANSAVLDLKSTTRGFLPPRLTFDQRNSIVNPEAGLVLYCTNCSWDGQLQVYNGTFWESMMGTPGDDVPTIGDQGPGGMIFYIFQPGEEGYIPNEMHGLIVGGAQGGIGWGCSGLDITGADGTELGTGLQNTNDIINVCSDQLFAANYCSQNGNFWLPSKDELLLLKNSGVGNIYSECVPPWYYYCQLWTSSEINADSVWILDFATYNFIPGSKNNNDGGVICISNF